MDDLQPLASIIDGPMTMACIVLGVVGNMRAWCILTAARLNRRLVASLKVLAVCDSLLLSVTLGYYSIQAVMFLLDVPFPTDALVAVLHAFISAFNTGSVWLIVLITVQRFTAIRKPFDVLDGSQWSTRAITAKTTKLHTPHRMNSVLITVGTFYKVPIGLVLLALLVNFPAFFEIRLIVCWDLRTERLSDMLWPTSLRLNQYYQMFYRVGFKMIVQSMGPFALVLGVTLATQILLHRKLSRRRLLVAAGRSPLPLTVDSAMNYVSIMIVGKFLALRALPFILDIWETFFPDYAWTLTFQLVVKISNLLIVVNSSTNCLVYLDGHRMVDTVRGLRSARVSDCDELSEFMALELQRLRNNATLALGADEADDENDNENDYENNYE
uniref:G-protein coupled receptors family 1 profile domain-containing protein n=1 Tax=Plectus sambesii TaxID=2011161 RepID=A0A914X5Z0_9BILA